MAHSSTGSAPQRGTQTDRSAPANFFVRATDRRWQWIALAFAIAVAAFAARALTLQRALPYVDHPDEPNPVDYVIGMLKTGDLNPHAFQKPSLYVYLLLGVLSVHYRAGLASGLYGDLNQMFITTHLYTTLPQFFLWGRVLTAAIGGLSVLAAFFAGRTLWSAGAGIVAALFLALSPFHLRHSQYVTTDVTSGLFVLLSFVASVLAAERGRWRDYLLAGLFAGFAASTKYNVGVIALPIVVAHVLHWRGKWLRELPRLVAAGAISLAGFLLGTPYALLSFDEFQRGILGQVGDYSGGGHGDFTGAWNWGGYFAFFTGPEVGIAAFLATCAGLVIVLRKRQPLGVLWLSFAAAYLLLHVSQGSHFTRNMAPLVVLAAPLVGIACAAGIDWAGQRRASLRPFAAALLLIALLWLPAAESLRHSQRMARGDTRVHALAWIESNVPPGTRIAAELKPIPGPIESRWTEVESLLPHDLAWYRQQGYGFVLASSDVWRQWDQPASYQQYAAQPPVAEWGGATPREMLGPHIVLYATGLGTADVPEPVENAVVGGARLLGVGIGVPNTQPGQVGISPTRAFKAGDILGLRTFWQVEGSFDHDYLIFVHVLNAAGTRVAQRDTPPWQGLFPTTTWKPGSLVVDINDLALPANLPPGEYQVIAGMYSPELNTNPPTTVGGVQQGAVPLGTITIEGN